jgi:iron(III) transport system substrate-binding protein
MVGLVVTALLASCSSNNAGNSNSSGSTASSVDPAALASAAAKEGELTWYTSFTDQELPAIVGAFNKAYPGIKVNAVKLSDTMVPRITTEQRGGKYVVDVVSTSADSIAELFSANALVKYDAPDAPSIPGVTIPEGYRNIVYVKSTVIGWNPTALKAAGLPTPTTWEDFTKPEWKGKFSIIPSISGLDFYEGLIAAQGHDKALAFINALGKNDPIIATSHTQATTQVQAGEPIATVNAYSYLAAGLKKKTPEQMNFVNTDPLLNTVNPVALATKAPHPNAAKLLINWLESKNGQDAVISTGGKTSMVPGADNDSTTWDPSKWKPVFAQPDLTPTQIAAYLKEYKAAFGVNS